MRVHLYINNMADNIQRLELTEVEWKLIHSCVIVILCADATDSSRLWSYLNTNGGNPGRAVRLGLHQIRQLIVRDAERYSANKLIETIC